MTITTDPGAAQGPNEAQVSCREMISRYLLDHGYDGLWCGECGCELGDLMPCGGGEWSLDCKAGYKLDGDGTAHDGEPVDWWICATKAKAGS